MLHIPSIGRTSPAKLLLSCIALAGLAVLALGQAPCAEGRVLVKFRNGASPQSLAKAELLGAKPIRTLALPQIHMMEIPRGADEAKFAEALSRNPNVEFAEPDYVLQLDEIDPLQASQWHLPKISAISAWGVTLGSPTLKIAILDSGVDPDHPDLASKLVDGWNLVAGNSNFADDNGHGTAVAGCATAVTNNGIGIAGLAPNCLIMPVKVASSDGYAYISTLANGLTYAANNGARVANMSFAASTNSTVNEGMKYFVSKGGVVSVSAGNDGKRILYADNPNCLTVSATDSNDVKTSWSSYGAIVDLAAPGLAVLTTNNGGGYASWSGTSFSAPIVAGAAAMVLSANPNLTPAQAMDVLKVNADDLGATGYDIYYGAGRVNVYKAALAASGSPIEDTTPPTVGITNPTNGATVSGTVTVSVNASDNVGIQQIDVYVDQTLVRTILGTTGTYDWDTTQVSDGLHTVKAVATDTSGNTAQTTVSVTVANDTGGGDTDTVAPVVTIKSPTDGATFTTKLTVIASATDNVAVTRMEVWVDGKLTTTRDGSAISATYNTRKWAKGDHILEVKAYDAAGNVGTRAVSVTKT